MRLIACSYEHIGPFADHIRLVRFLSGATLIKAPIGSGKSFLFFDGPLFGLYKRGQRPMLHRQSTHGQIQTLWSEQHEQWLVIRDIKSTKAGNDSVTSRLFRVHASIEQIYAYMQERFGQEVIGYDTHLVTLLPPERLEEISAKGQKEIDDLIQSILPPKEVTLSACILMQESDNIFEMTPATRISVFKQLFNLLDMDAVREYLAEMKKQTQIRRQVLQEDMTMQQQFSQANSQLQQDIDCARQLSQLFSVAVFTPWIEQPLFADQSIFAAEHIQMTATVLHGYNFSSTKQLIVQAEQDIQDRLVRQGQGEQLQQELSAGQATLHHKKKQLDTLLLQKERLALQLRDWAKDDLFALQTEIARLEEQLQQIGERFPYATIQQFGFVVEGFLEARRFFDEEIAHAQRLQQEMLVVQEKQGLIQEQYNQTDQQYAHLQQQYEQLTTKLAQENGFFCDKIQGDCPYVDLIRRAGAQTIRDQQTHVMEQLQLLGQRKQDLQRQIAKEEDTIAALVVQTEKKKEFFLALGRKETELLLKEAEQYIAQRDLLLRKLHEHTAAQVQYANIQAEYDSLNKQITQGVQDIDDLSKSLADREQHLLSYNTEQIRHEVQQYKEAVTRLQTLDQRLLFMQGLVDQWVARQEHIRQLVEKEALLKDLLAVFQKELLVVVLQDFLPVLEDIINTYLQKVVSFVLRFELPKTMQEQIEITLWIEDEKGKRSVKSLSGGQKAVLRLCRILAVSSLFHQEYLLLDETINSLDSEAIGRVADLLDDFIKQREIIFYLVTHAPQIQDMPFWHRIVTLSDIFEKSL